METVVNGNKAKKPNRRVKRRAKEKIINRKMKLIGVNCAGLSSKLYSFDKMLKDIQPAIFFLQETKLKRVGKINTENSNNKNT